MKGPKFILNRLKENFDVSEEQEQEGFPDMNYVVGNTSGLDVGNIPTPVDRRIGDQAQIGGSAMEVQIYNPATFSIEGDQIIDVVDQLGLDITLHSEPNMGYASAYKTQGQQGVGIGTVHPYFTNYLEEMAKFKQKAERKADFNIGRINPHASTSPMPPLEERMPMDVGMDPFGFKINGLDKDELDMRDMANRSIFRNEQFLEKFYKMFLLKKAVDRPWQLYTNFLSRYSEKFDRIFRDAQRQACDNFYDVGKERMRNKETEDLLQGKAALVSTAARSDVGVQNVWLDLISEKWDEDEQITIEISIPNSDNSDEITIDSLDSINEILDQTTRVSRLRTLPEAIYRIENKEFIYRNQLELKNVVDGEKLEAISQKALSDLNDKLDKIWNGNGDKFLISVEGKRSALSNHLDYDPQRIVQKAEEYDGNDFDKSNEGPWELDNAAVKTLTGEKKFFESGRYREMLRALGNQYEQPMWMESNLFYYIIPCWMSSSSVENEKHEGWNAPEFIWKALVEDEWSEKYEINLKEPATEDGYFDALEESHEFRMDVAAATAACYVWGHFTQMDSEFNSGESTWMEFMNKHGIGVNLEAMHGSPQQLLKLWRPKDIATASHAINITARNKLGDMHPELDSCIAKFTIDMEHVASFGANPWNQMKEMIENEEKIASYEDYTTGINPEKPLAKILRQYHLMKPGVESQQGTYHGPFRRGDKQLYTWIYRLVEDGFARNKVEQAALMYEQGEEKESTIYTARIAMNMIELGIEPEEVTVDNVDPSKEEYRDEREALIARFFGIDKANYSKEWTKIEEHAFDPLEGLLEAEEFDYTYSSKASIEQGENRPGDYMGEEYR